MVEVILLETGDRLDVIGDVNYTKMVSDIGDISKINTSFTWSLRFPKTPRNAMALDGLGINGSESTKPYETIKVALIENGFPILRNGNLQITETNKTEYVGNIKDGIIDFFNAMGDESLADLDISELDHNNTVSEIFATWIDLNNNLPYKYLLANYNGRFLEDVDGKTNFSNTSLIPSAKASYLLDKIFEKHGWTYSGLNVEDTYLSYPLNSDYDVTTGLVVGSGGMNSFAWTLSKGWNFKPFTFDTSGNDPEYVTIQVNSFVIQKEGAYGINLPQYDFEGRSIEYMVSVLGFQFFEPGFYSLGNLNVGDMVGIMIRAGKNSRKKRTYNLSFQGDITIHRLDASLISFSTNLTILKQRDFIKELMMQNAVISIADATKKHIEFVTIDQRLNSSETEDWSKYFVEKEKEVYILGSYAQNNYLKHKYGAEGENYNDGNLVVNNKNLKIDETLFESKAYTNERLDLEIKATPNNLFIPTLKTFEIEVKESGGNIQLEYNTITDRMFFCKFQYKLLGVYVNGQYYGVTPGAIPLTFKSIVAEKYNDIDFIINNAKLVTLKLALPSLEVLNLDFKKKYMFQQINGFYLIDRLNYKAGGVSTVDFIKIG